VEGNAPLAKAKTADAVENEDKVSIFLSLLFIIRLRHHTVSPAQMRSLPQDDHLNANVS
jgi:hypothetical protein